MRYVTLIAARRAIWILASVVMVCAGCTASPARPSAAGHPRPASSHPATTPTTAHAAPGGCGATSMVAGPPPGWNAQPAGFTGAPLSLPYVVGGSDSIMGYLWGRPLYAPESPDHPNKVLWFVRYSRDGAPLRVTGHLETDPGRTMSATFPADSSPGEIYPSYLTVPVPGCWSFTLRWNTHVDHLSLSFAPLPR